MYVGNPFVFVCLVVLLGFFGSSLYILTALVTDNQGFTSWVVCAHWKQLKLMTKIFCLPGHVHFLEKFSFLTIEWWRAKLVPSLTIMMKVWPCSSCGVDKWVLQIRGPPAFKIILPWQIALIWLTKDDVEYEESSEGRYQQSQLSNYNVASPTDSLIRIKLAYLHAFLPHQGYIVSEWCLPISMQSLNLVHMDGNPRQITWYIYVYCAPIMDCQNDKVLMTSFLE